MLRLERWSGTAEQIVSSLTLVGLKALHRERLMALDFPEIGASC